MSNRPVSRLMDGAENKLTFDDAITRMTMTNPMATIAGLPWIIAMKIFAVAWFAVVQIRGVVSGASLGALVVAINALTTIRFITFYHGVGRPNGTIPDGFKARME